MELFLIMLAIGIYSWWSESKGNSEKKEDSSPLPPIAKEPEHPVFKKVLREGEKGGSPLFKKLQEAAEEQERRLQEESREIFESMQQHPPKKEPSKMNDEVKERERPSTVEVIEHAREENRHTAALNEQITVYEDAWTRPKKVLKQEDLLPKTEQDLIRGVIFSEIMSPPKSKRRRL